MQLGLGCGYCACEVARAGMLSFSSYPTPSIASAPTSMMLACLSWLLHMGVWSTLLRGKIQLSSDSNRPDLGSHIVSQQVRLSWMIPLRVMLTVGYAVVYINNEQPYPWTSALLVRAHAVTR
eukprot:scaffold39501_cov21-Tisochrysis_lutea.AAC.1